ncbi:MAG: cytochrome c [Casimicrobiaceae bacterium]|nr:cytochrome c [Casimicrobiaceae bacterium]MCX8099369.1 cytochrome c [Casimicrobiaceae bacterium]MDW8311971.1 cytochrome c [Burkholderiales bacterium]
MEWLGLYPQFYVPEIGTAWMMGIIATIHVVASHTSVGASFLFALLATKAWRDNRPELMDFVKKYGVFLLVFSYIIGSITGPGIWYSITVASPRGVGGLIHNFVWVWAAEWVFFVVEVIGVYALVYLIGKIDLKTHMKLCWSFALASWATMLLIVGILSFMMWPGNDDWYRTGSTNDAFYNLNFFAHLGTRTGAMFVMAVIVGLMVASRLKDEALRRSVVRMLAPIGLVGGLFAVMMFIYYLQTLPYNALVMLNAHLRPQYAAGMVSVFVVATLWLLFAWWRPQRIYTSLAVAVFAYVSLMGVWPEERMRESMRKPFVAGQYIYSNQIIARDVPGKNIVAEVDRLAEHGYLKLHPWIPARLRTLTENNQLEVGQLLAKTACSNCHALEPGAPLRNLPDKFHRATDEDLIAAFLNGALKHGTQPYMPRIDLPEHEVRALAHYLAAVNRGEDVERRIAEQRAKERAVVAQRTTKE